MRDFRHLFWIAIYAFLSACSPMAWADLQQLIGTKFTEVSLDEKGNQKIIRRYDKIGRLRELTFLDKSMTPPLKQVVTIERDADSAMIQTELTYNGATLNRRETQFFLRNGMREKTETLWSAGHNGIFDRKDIETYAGGEIAITHLAADATTGGWKKIGTESHKGILNDGPYGLSKIAIGDYVKCLTDSNPQINAAECRRGLQYLIESVGKTEFGNYTKFACSSDGTYYLPTGYRIDLSSCADENITSDDEATRNKAIANTKTATDALVRATQRVTGDLLSCLEDINHEAAVRFVVYLERFQPKIYCAGQTSKHDRLAQIRYKPDEVESGKEALKKSLTGDNADADVARQTGLYLFKSTDPVVNTSDSNNINVPTVPENKIRKMKTRDERIEARKQNYWNFAPEPSLAPIIFHESLHLMGFNSGNGHKYDDPADEVYACTELCSGPATKAFEDTCLGCMKAKGHEISDEDRAFCKKHFPARPD